MNDANSESNPSGPSGWPLPKIPPPKWAVVLPFLASEQAAPKSAGGSGDQIQKADFGASRHSVRSIIALKLDHYGDFIIGLPALRALRDAFPDAVIRLVCGKWNEGNALVSGLFDEVRCYNFFPEQPVHGRIMESDPLWEFDAAAEGRYDIAIDLRVDGDTRHLLGRIDAGLRCGIGCMSQFPLLDVALPLGHAPSANVGASYGRFLFLPPERFNSSLPFKGPLHQFGPLVPGDVLHGPFTELPSGRLIAEVGLTIRGHVPGLRRASVLFEVALAGGQTVARRMFGRRSVLQLRYQPVEFEFDNPGQESQFGFRVSVEGRPARGTVRFSGVIVHQREAAFTARYRPSELHIGERLSLLVGLVRERTANLYGPMAGRLTRAVSTTEKPARPAGRLRIAVAPFSNSAIRNWPASYYASLISLLLERLPCEVLLLGTPGQAVEALEITGSVQSPLLIDLVGRTTWDELQDVLRTADLVICNNSGTAHLAAALDAKVLAIYSGSHPPREWGPRGMRAQALTYAMPCSPCAFETLAECTAGHACMRQITPDYVLLQAEAALVPQTAAP